MTAADILRNLEFGRSCHGAAGSIVDGKPTGAVRISFGYMTRRSEIDSFIKFISESFGERELVSDVVLKYAIWNPYHQYCC